MQKTPGLTPRRLLYGLIKVSWGLRKKANQSFLGFTQSFLGFETGGCPDWSCFDGRFILNGLNFGNNDETG